MSTQNADNVFPIVGGTAPTIFAGFAGTSARISVRQGFPFGLLVIYDHTFQRPPRRTVARRALSHIPGRFRRENERGLLFENDKHQINW